MNTAASQDFGQRENDDLTSANVLNRCREGTRGKEMRGKMDEDDSLKGKWLFYLGAEDKDTWSIHIWERHLFQLLPTISSMEKGELGGYISIGCGSCLIL